MKNKREKDFHLLRVKIALRTMITLFFTLAMVYMLYVFLHGHFADFMVSVLQGAFGMEYSAALDFYERVFRRHMDGLILLSIAGIAVLLFYVHLCRLTAYFQQISKGLDDLLQDMPGDISLAPELLAIERKINLAKHQMEQQKNEMQQTEQRKNDLVMYLAHDLKTPLATSISYLNLLRDEKQISPELREKYLGISLAKAERLEDLLNEFLEIAKYNLSNITLQYREINLTRLLEQLIYESQSLFVQKDLTCSLDAADDILLQCDADKIQRVFDNLLRNAVVYSNAGTQISITAKRMDGQVQLTFLNHGDTIPKEKLSRIFEQFYQLDAGRGTNGIGLGLAIAKQIVLLHKGSITAESENGLTVFTVALPAL